MFIIIGNTVAVFFWVYASMHLYIYSYYIHIYSYHQQLHKDFPALCHPKAQKHIIYIYIYL